MTARDLDEDLVPASVMVSDDGVTFAFDDDAVAKWLCRGQPVWLYRILVVGGAMPQTAWNKAL